MKLKCGLLGATLRHSYSKQIHSVFGDYEYELLEVSPEKAAEIIKSGEYKGLNVTIPYKELAYSLCDELSEDATAAKSVNTVVYKDGKICGHNTDVFGFISMLAYGGISVTGKNVVILGSGGTSKTAYLAAKKLSAKKICIVSRSGEINYENIYDACADAEIIVNTTPVGMYPKVGVSPIELSRFGKCEGVADVIYNPKKTKLIFDAERLGLRCVSGLYMLAAQGKRAADIFFDNVLSEELIGKAERCVRNITENIVLIGMPGSGKSTVARLVAEKTGKRFVDTDEVISESYGKPSDIINEKGEKYFRDIEAEVLRLVGKESNCVISTGGGVVEREENLESLSQNGKLFLIKRDLALLERAGRPLSVNLEALYESRREKYLRFADFEVENDSTPGNTAQKIIELFVAGK